MKIHEQTNRQLQGSRRQQAFASPATTCEFMPMTQECNLIEVDKAGESFIAHPPKQHPQADEVHSRRSSPLRKPSVERTRTDDRDEAARGLQ
jgi:hypothetical protein